MIGLPLDGDNMLEFLSLEVNPDIDVFPTVVRFYEIDSDGYQTLIWEFLPLVVLEGEFVDAKIGDIKEITSYLKFATYSLDPQFNNN